MRSGGPSEPSELRRDERKRPSVGAAGWRAGGAPGLRPEKMSVTVSTKTDAPRGGFPEACVGWPCSGLTAAPPTGGDVLRHLPERLSIPLSPCPDHTPGGGDKGVRTLRPDPAPSTPAAIRSQALRALRATGREECGTGRDRVGENGARNGGGVEGTGEFRRCHRNIRLLPNEVGEVARRRSRRDGGALQGVHGAWNPSTAPRSPSPWNGEETGRTARTDPRVKPEDGDKGGGQRRGQSQRT